MMKPSIIILFSFRILRLSCAVQPLTENCKIVATSDTRINIFNDNHEETDIFDENFKHTVFRCDGDGFSYGFELPTAENQHMQQLLDTGGLVINESTLLKKANVIVEGNTIISLGIQPWSFARNEGQERRRSEEGNKPILAVKVTDVNGLADPDTPATIGDNIFGTLGDPVNLKSQMYACSFEKLNIVNEYSVNITDHEAAPGVIEVTISISLKAHDRYAIHDAVTAAVQTKLGFNLPGPFEQVMYVLENCYVGCGWAAYAYINSWMSVYQGGYYAQAGVQMHEIGHNFGFAHSGGLDGQAYTDHTCQMGNPLYGDDEGKMCFNPAKNWAIGWYDSKKTEININTNFINRVETIVGVADFKNNPDNRNVIIKLETGTSNDYFVGFNRAIGVNSQNDEADNEVTIILTGNDGISYSQSYLQATLKQDESWELNGMIITAEEINVISNPGTAKVSIMKGSNPTNSPIRLPTPPTSPTLPTNRPTNSPIKAPTQSPGTVTLDDVYFKDLALNDIPGRNITLQQNDDTVALTGQMTGRCRDTTCPSCIKAVKLVLFDPNGVRMMDQCKAEHSGSDCAFKFINERYPINKNIPGIWEVRVEGRWAWCRDQLDNFGVLASITVMQQFDTPTPSPTRSPIKPPTSVPTTSHTELPTSSPTRSPIKPPTLVPTTSPTELPTSSPTRNPNKQPTPSPTQAPVIIESSPPTKLDSCSETSGARFLMKMKKNNGDIEVKVKSCNWLRKIKKESKRTKICERKVFCYEEYRSAGDTCTETCDTCDPCYENSRSKFYHKTNKRGKVITKRCSWLDTKDNEQVEIACQKSVPTGVCYGSAMEVCPQSCPTPAGAMGCG